MLTRNRNNRHDQHKLILLIIFGLAILIMFIVVDSRITALDHKVDRVIRLTSEALTTKELELTLLTTYFTTTD